MGRFIYIRNSYEIHHPLQISEEYYVEPQVMRDHLTVGREPTAREPINNIGNDNNFNSDSVIVINTPTSRQLEETIHGHGDRVDQGNDIIERCMSRIDGQLHAVDMESHRIHLTAINDNMDNVERPCIPSAENISPSEYTKLETIFPQRPSSRRVSRLKSFFKRFESTDNSSGNRSTNTSGQQLSQPSPIGNTEQSIFIRFLRSFSLRSSRVS